MRLVVLVVSALAVGLVGCGDDSEVCSEGGTGSLQINVSGLPLTTNAAVTVTRGAESRTLTGTTLLEGLGSGTWTVTVSPVTTPVGLIRAAHDATPEPQEVCVRDGGVAAVQVAYKVIPSSLKLWLSTSNGSAEVEAFEETSLRATGTLPASVLLRSSPGIPRAAGLAFDRRGNLWVALGSGELRRYPASVLGDSGTRTPDITLTGPALSTGTPGPIGIAFDASGNLWTSVGWSNKVLRFGASQITASGSPTPEVEISGVGDPHALAFDSAGNLWVGDYTSGAPRVHKVAVAALAASGTVTPAKSIDSKDTSPVISFTSPAGLAFDASGNLWVAYGTQGVVVRLTPTELSGTGTATVTPGVQIDAGGPKGIAFDEAGNLWMAYNAGKISRLSPAQLTASGAPTPDVVITSPDLGATDGVAIYPAPARLPLYHALP